MGVRGIYGPFIHSNQGGAGQGARLSTGSPANFPREEGSDG
jgi:hypothetical protein